MRTILPITLTLAFTVSVVKARAQEVSIQQFGKATFAPAMTNKPPQL